MQVSALGALWRAIGCAKHACGKRDSADDFAIFRYVWTLVVSCSAMRQSLPLCRSLVASGFELPSCDADGHWQARMTPARLLHATRSISRSHNSIGLLTERTITCRLLLFRRHRAHTRQHRKHRDADSTGPESPTAGPTSVAPDCPHSPTTPGSPGKPPGGSWTARRAAEGGGVMDLTTLVSGHLRYLGLGSPLIGESKSIFNRTTGAGLALGQGTAASPTAG